MIKAKRIAKLTGSVLLWTIVGVAVLLLVFYAFAASGRTIPGGLRPMIVLSGSMEPKMPVGSVVVAKSANPTSLKAGDIITFSRAQSAAPSSSSGILVTHRIEQVVAAGATLSFVTKGDANNVPDGTPVLANQVVGRVFLVVPYAGYVTRFVRTPLGLILLILLPAVILIGGEVRNVFRGTTKLLKGGGTIVLALTLAAAGAAQGGRNAGTAAYFHAGSSTPATFSTGTWGTPHDEIKLSLTPGQAKAVRPSQVPPGAADFPIASLDTTGAMKLDFGELNPGNSNNSPDVFRIKNMGEGPIEITIEATGDFAPFVVRIGGGSHDGMPIVLQPGEEYSVDIKVDVAKGMDAADYEGSICVSAADGSFALNIPALLTVTGKGDVPKNNDGPGIEVGKENPSEGAFDQSGDATDTTGTTETTVTAVPNP